MKFRAVQRPLAVAILSALPLAVLAAPAGDAAPAAKSHVQAKAVLWETKIPYRSVTLRVTGPGGLVFDRDFGNGKPTLELKDLPWLADGEYNFELVFGRIPDAQLDKAMATAQHGEDGSVADAALAARLQALRETASGTFRVQGGTIVPPDLAEFGEKGAVLTNADGIIRNSLCVGIDCLDGESFGFDTIRMKENNARLNFDDTSTGSFPANDWRLVANDSANGGASYLAIEDATAARLVFQVRAGAPANSLFVDSGGRVGFRTGTPVLDLHARTGNTPGIRLEQDGSSGFTAQTWDIAGNEANFFIRDVTGGSKLPFRIRPGAPTSSIDVAASGNVGIGTASPLNKLDVAGGIVTSRTNTQELQFNGGSGKRWRWISAINGATAGSMFLQYTTDGFVSSFVVPLEVLPNGNVGLGATNPGSKLHVQGNMTVTGSLQVSGPCCGPDYVFDPTYRLASIEEQSAYMWRNRHLPSIGAARSTKEGNAVIDVFAQSNGMLEELEKAHIYIGQLHSEIGRLKEEIERKDAAIKLEIQQLRRLLDK